MSTQFSYGHEDKDSQNTKRSTNVAKELFADYVKEKKLREREEKKKLAQTLKTYFLCRSEIERIRSMYNKTIIRFGFCDIQSNQGLIVLTLQPCWNIFYL